MTADTFDLIVVGGGTAGLRTALYAASHNHLVALVEPGALGGTCLNTGCIPTKALLYASSLMRKAHTFKDFGIQVSTPKADCKKIMSRVQGIVQDGQDHIAVSVKNKNLTVIREKASFIDKSTIQAGKRKLSAKKIIICTGAKPLVPPLKGIDKVSYLMSDDVMHLKKIPKSIVVIGGGYIALELATFFSDLGVKVTILERNPRLLSEVDEEVASLLTEIYKKRGLAIVTNASIAQLYAGKLKKIDYTVPDKKGIQTVTAEELLIAAGRAPHTSGLNLEAAGINKGARGNIEVNNELQTSNPNVYAIGDVTGRAMFAHAAKRESHIALQNTLDGLHETMNFDLVPWAVFTAPPISGIGITEAKAKELGIPYTIAQANFVRAGRAVVTGSAEGFVKIVFHKETRKLLGAVMIGPSTDELIHELAAFINLNATIDDVYKIIHIHPTLSEVMEALKEIGQK